MEIFIPQAHQQEFVGALFAYDLWVIATAALVGALCGVLGCYLLLRRLSMLGDAISHAIPPGLAGAFLLSGSRSLAWMLLGAGVVGVLTGLLTAGLHRVAKIAEDASMGVVFTTLFALGVLLISFAARDVDLDPGCVLYGLLEFTPLDTVSFWGLELPRATASLAAAALIVAGVLAVVDRLAGGGDRIAAEAGAPYETLTTIDDIYPDRPDK